MSTLDCIIPIGPNHDQLANRAIESVRIATLDKGDWEQVNIRIKEDLHGYLGRNRS